MNSIRRSWEKVLVFARGEKFHNELEEERAVPRDEKEKELRAAGMAGEDARHAANREFGNDLKLREESRDVFGFWWDTTLQDFRFAPRQLRKNMGSPCPAVLVLALGLAASIAIFAFVDAALIKPLPYRNTSRLVGVFEAVPIFPLSNISYQDFLDWKKRNTVFSSFDAY